MKTKQLFKTKYLSLYKTKQGFIYAQRRNFNSTASLCFMRKGKEIFFLIRFQPLPIVNTIKNLKWNDLFACPITGSMEKKQIPLQNAINEVYEEGNLKISKKNLVDFSSNVATTQMNEIVFNFLFDVTGLRQLNKKQGDGSIFEEISSCRWLTYKEVKNIVKSQNKNLYLSSLLSCLSLFEKKYGKIKN